MKGLANPFTCRQAGERHGKSSVASNNRRTRATKRKRALSVSKAVWTLHQVLLKHKSSPVRCYTFSFPSASYGMTWVGVSLGNFMMPHVGFNVTRFTSYRFPESWAKNMAEEMHKAQNIDPPTNNNTRRSIRRYEEYRGQ